MEHPYDTTESDEALYARYMAKRDEEAFRILFLRHKERLILFLYGIVHQPDDAEELMIDAFAEAAAGKAAFSGKSSFRTWLFSIGKKKALTHLRKYRAPLPEDAELPDDPELSPEGEILRVERNRQLYSALSKLNGDYRQILILLYFEEMSCEEAGRVMGKNKKQIYHLAERGKAALRAELERMGFDEAQYAR